MSQPVPRLCDNKAAICKNHTTCFLNINGSEE
jgi:hypothetical protein